MAMHVRTIARRLHALGLTSPPPTRVTEDELQAARMMLDGGDTYADVSRQLGRPHKTWWRLLPGYELNRSQVSRRGAVALWNKRKSA